MTAAKKKSSTTKRLTPKPEVLRELYLLSGNNCAMPDCDNVIIDHSGVVVGHVCHIEAAMPDGARFNPVHSNEDRRSIDNLVLMCAGHHAQIDSKKNETTWSVAKLKQIKTKHEKKFKGLDKSLKQAFDTNYVDSTDSLAPTIPSSFAELERLLPETELPASEARSRSKEMRDFVERLSRVPEDERQFMASLIQRATKLKRDDGRICVHVNDVKSAFKIGHTKIRSLGESLARYGVGSVDTEVGAEDEPHVSLCEPSDYVMWADIVRFCDESGHDLNDFVLRLKFDLLDK